MGGGNGGSDSTTSSTTSGGNDSRAEQLGLVGGGGGAAGDETEDAEEPGLVGRAVSSMSDLLSRAREFSLSDLTVSSEGEGACENLDGTDGVDRSTDASEPVFDSRPGSGGDGDLTPVEETPIPDDYDRNHDRWLDQYGETIGEYAADHDMTPDEYVDAVDAELDRLVVEEGEPRVRVRMNDFESVLEDGFWKTQFEDAQSSGVHDPDARADFEEAWMGYDRDTAPQDRPVYGYVSPTPQDGDDLDTGTDAPFAVGGYGQVDVRLSDDVRERATISGDDSLNLSLADDPSALRRAPTRMEDPGIESLNPEKGDPLERLRSMDDAGGAEPYIETQYHGGLTLEDVEEVVFRNRDPPDGMQDRLDRMGIPYRHTGDEDWGL